MPYQIRIKMETLTLKKLTADQVRNHRASEYNRYEWIKMLDRALKFDPEAEFYEQPADEHFSYDRLYMTYTMPGEGFKVLNDFSYSGGLTNRAWSAVLIKETGEFEVVRLGITNDKQGRKALAEITKINPAVIFTTSI